MKRHNKNQLVIIKNKIAKLYNPHTVKAGYAKTPDTQEEVICVETSKKLIKVSK